MNRYSHNYSYIHVPTITADFFRLFTAFFRIFAAFNLKLDVGKTLFSPPLVSLLLDFVQSRLKQCPSFLVQPLLLISLSLRLERGGGWVRIN